MRNLMLVSQYRDVVSEIKFYGEKGDGGNGIFRVPSPIDGQELAVIASSGFDWDHVSVSRSNRCPNWPEMEHIKRLFFTNDECAMQLHVPVNDHISFHPNCLHLWRPQKADIPRPPSWMVAPEKKEANR